MKQAHFASQQAELAAKKDSEAARRQYEINADRVDLARMNASALNPSATMTAGP